MRQRVTSSIAVVVIALVPIVLGGPVFAFLMVTLANVGYTEFVRLTRRIGSHEMPYSLPGYVILIALGISALLGVSTVVFVGIVAVAAFVPLVVALTPTAGPNSIAGAAFTVLGSLYLGIPIVAAISLREVAGPVAHQWLADLANLAAVGWPSAPRGLAWTALVVFTIWVGDSTAYLAGRSLGRRPLAPRISPKKTIEGSVTGLVGSGITAMLCAGLFGLNLPVLGALAFGVGLGIVGQLGDLVESMMKRQAGVKDSGAVIPGHGGVLDRIDALLLAFPVAWVVSSLVDGSL